ncbi:MAG: hypothetical protein GY866_18690, partial [Proteobacteria bacterium]|nr:hypothetical protein [Pseudomonadota bacterium]
MIKPWKDNWPETRQNFTQWWNREGLVIGMWGGVNATEPNETLDMPPMEAQGSETFYSDVDARITRNHFTLANKCFPTDIMPIAHTDIGPGSLALHLGSQPGFADDTVWYHPFMDTVSEPEKLPPLRFDPQEKWWKIQEETLRKTVVAGKGKYIASCPDLVENIDTLASLRGTSNLLMDMVERSDWVAQKVAEINQAYFQVYDRIYEIIKLEDGSAAYEAYMLWGPGKTIKVQCDTATMFSPDMFNRFVVPSLTEQCEYVDYSMYHLDGKEEFVHLDALLDIDALDAIEWTPNDGELLGGDPKWFDLYRRILDAGKSVQAY